ncbi:MAG: dipicolinate synthase subunit DpsA [Bacillota bacterium]
MKPFSDFQATVVGGDARQIAVASALIQLFKKVKIFGHPQAMVPNPIESCTDIVTALADVRVIVLPIGGMDDEGLVRSYQGEHSIDFGKYLSSLPEETLIVTGSFTNRWLALAEKLKFKVLQYADDDEIAVLNSIPTAEGALQIAMEELPITIHGSKVVIIGFGRVGVTLARVFKAMGAQVIVSARRKSALARALEMGCQAILIDSLSEAAGNVDLIINTVPALIIDSGLIAEIQPETLIIDLASAPGGTDFEAAKKRNIKAILTPGLPGLVAPKSAGEILAATIPKLITDFLQKGVELYEIFRD